MRKWGNVYHSHPLNAWFSLYQCFDFFHSQARSSDLSKSRKPLRHNYFSSAKYLMVRTIWLV